MNIYHLFSKELNSNRVFGLDLLRAIAILLVVSSHGNYFFSKKMMDYYRFIDFDGVSLFFVLSGFLIGVILIKQLENQPASFKLLLNFWVRRWFRTLPTYFLILLTLTILNKIFNPFFTFSSVQKYYYFFQNLYFYEIDGFFPESWSLSVEEWFYLLVPVLIFSLLYLFKTPKRVILFVIIFIISLVFFIRYLGHLKIVLFSPKLVITRLDAIMYGVFGAYVYFYHQKYWKMRPKTLFVLGLFLFAVDRYVEMSSTVDLFNCYFECSIAPIGTLLLLPFLSDLKKPNFKILNWVTIISTISYSMYLINMSLVRDFIIVNLPWTGSEIYHDLVKIINYTLYWGITISLSIIIYLFFEHPITNLRDKISLHRFEK